MPTDYTYTGQYSNTADFGLMYYNARWYDPVIGRFTQADTIVPAGVQGYDRYAYVNNNPVKYIDPTGHKACDDIDEDGECIPSDLTSYIKYVAHNKGIRLSPRDHLSYKDFIAHELGEPSIIGTTPRIISDDPDYDENGNPIHLRDDGVYITEAAFQMCNGDIECLAAVIAHEVTHLWIEYFIETQGTRGPVGEVETAFSGPYEEIYVDLSLMHSPKVSPGMINALQSHLNRYCNPKVSRPTPCRSKVMT